MATVTERLDKHDKQIASIRALVQEGMQLVVQSRKDIRALTAAQRKTDEALKKTDAVLRAFISGQSQRAGNGHSKKNIDLS